MDEPETTEKKKKVRVRTRIPDRRVGGQIPRISRRRVAAVLILAAAAGIFIGLVLGRGIRKMVRIRREQDRIVQSGSGFGPGIPESAAGDSAGESESPGR